jgi:hypothetical protein
MLPDDLEDENAVMSLCLVELTPLCLTEIDSLCSMDIDVPIPTINKKGE